MLFHEYAVTPQVFNEEYIEKDITAQIYLKIFLTNLRTNGLLANMNNNEWLKKVNEYRKGLSPKLRDELSKIFEELSKRNRIVEHKTLIEPILEEEIDWLKLALKEDGIKPYLALLFTGKFQVENEKTMTLEKFMVEDFSNDDNTPLLQQTLENMEKYLTDFLSYAKRLIIIDPYFTYNKEDEKALLLFAKLYARRRGVRIKKRKIIINIFYNTRDRFVDPSSQEYRQKWVTLFQNIYNKFDHIVRLNIWDDRNMHDRYMITDQGGISNSNGFSAYDYRKPHWSLLKNDELREQLNYFLPNANPSIKGKLVYSFTKDSGIKDNKTSESNKKPINRPVTGLKGLITNIADVQRGKEGFIKTDSDKYPFTISRLNKLSKELTEGIKVEFMLKTTEKGEIADIVKIIN